MMLKRKITLMTSLTIPHFGLTRKNKTAVTSINNQANALKNALTPKKCVE